MRDLQVQFLQECEDEFKVSRASGLSEEEVEKRRAVYGWNELEKHEDQSILKLLMDQLSDTLVRVLLFAAVLSFVLTWYRSVGRLGSEIALIWVGRLRSEIALIWVVRLRSEIALICWSSGIGDRSDLLTIWGLALIWVRSNLLLNWVLGRLLEEKGSRSTARGEEKRRLFF